MNDTQQDDELDIGQEESVASEDVAPNNPVPGSPGAEAQVIPNQPVLDPLRVDNQVQPVPAPPGPVIGGQVVPTGVNQSNGFVADDSGNNLGAPGEVTREQLELMPTVRRNDDEALRHHMQLQSEMMDKQNKLFEKLMGKLDNLQQPVAATSSPTRHVPSTYSSVPILDSTSEVEGSDDIEMDIFRSRKRQREEVEWAEMPERVQARKKFFQDLSCLTIFQGTHHLHLILASDQ